MGRQSVLTKLCSSTWIVNDIPNILSWSFRGHFKLLNGTKFDTYSCFTFEIQNHLLCDFLVFLNLLETLGCEQIFDAFNFFIGWMCWFKTPKLSHPFNGSWSNWCVQATDRPSITLHVSILYGWVSYKRWVTTTDLHHRFRNQLHFPPSIEFQLGYFGFSVIKLAVV